MRMTETADDALAAHRFPTTTDQLVAEFGDLRFELPDGSVTLREVFSHLPNEELANREDALFLLYGAFGEDAIGRKRYSDRDPPATSDTAYSPVSL